LLQQLDMREARVRAMVRNPAGVRRTPAMVVSGDFNDAHSLEAALDGVTRAYLVTPSSPDAEAPQIRFAELAGAAGVRHLVKLSQFAADEGSPPSVFFATMQPSNDGFESWASASRFSAPTCTSRGFSHFNP
jgi:uncharacterized protein YbjT (DUF2867 family)